MSNFLSLLKTGRGLWENIAKSMMLWMLAVLGTALCAVLCSIQGSLWTGARNTWQQKPERSSNVELCKNEDEEWVSLVKCLAEYQTTTPYGCRITVYRLLVEICCPFHSHSSSGVTRERRREKQSLQQYHKQIMQNDNIACSQMHHSASFDSDSPISNVAIAVWFI